MKPILIKIINIILTLAFLLNASKVLASSIDDHNSIKKMIFFNSSYEEQLPDKPISEDKSFKTCDKLDDKILAYNDHDHFVPSIFNHFQLSKLQAFSEKSFLSIPLPPPNPFIV